MLEFLIVGLGGFIGSCCRFGLNKVTAEVPLPIPFGTLLSNIIAGLLIGIVIGLEQASVGVTARGKLFLTTGLMGGLSTFSTFSMETVSLFQTGRTFAAVGNIGLNLILSLAAVVLGLCISRLIKGALA